MHNNYALFQLSSQASCPRTWDSSFEDAQELSDNCERLALLIRDGEHSIMDLKFHPLGEITHQRWLLA